MRRRLPFDILYEDRDVIAIDKPSGMLTVHTRAKETDTAEEWLNDYIRKGQAKSRKQVWLVHRLDRETSGVMIFAKSEEVAEYFRSNWNKLTEKTYIARVEGLMAQDSGVFESYLRDNPRTMKVASVKDSALGKFARTEWRKISEEDNTTLVEVKLKSGRKNQIRVHFSESGHPIVGDVKYGGMKASRLYLDSTSIAFIHPYDGRRIVVERATQL